MGHPPGEARRSWSEGPLPIREQFLPGAGFLAWTPDSAEVEAPQRWRVEVVVDAANTWTRSDVLFDLLEEREAEPGRRQPLSLGELRSVEPGGSLFFVDGELHRSTLRLSRGLLRSFELEVHLPWLDATGGFLDTTIEDYHELINIRDDQRPGVPRDVYTVYLRSPDGRELFLDRAPGAGLGEVVVSLKKTFWQSDPHWILGLEGAVKAPTGEEEDLYGTGSWDFGLRVLAGHRWWRARLDAGLGVTRLGAADRLGLGTQTRLAFFASLEFFLSQRISVVGQTQLFQSPFRESGIPKLEDDVSTYEIGLRGTWTRGAAFLALSENYRSFGNSADAGFHLGWSRTF